MGEYLHKAYEYASAENDAKKSESRENILEKLISFSKYGETHYLLKILGIKFKFPQKGIREKRKSSPYYYYKNHNIDITTLPPAKGLLRDLQLASLKLLEELDYVCEQAGLVYWLDGGTLLGAIRHKGFIPWDDDIDTAMLREDYIRLKDAFEKYSRNNDIYVDYYRSARNSCNCYLRVMHRKCRDIFVDIFPWDDYGKSLSVVEQIKESSKIIKLRRLLEKECTKSKSNEFVISTVAKAMQEKVLINNKILEEKSDFVWGIDFSHPWKNWFTKYDVLLPLQKIEFEGKEYPCLNNPHDFLERVYGDYMNYPKKLTCGHNIYREFTKEEQEIIKMIGDRNG